MATTTGWAERIAAGSYLKYLGLAAALGWHYALWFVPNTFHRQFLLDDQITYAWLVTLAATSGTVMVLALALGRRRHLDLPGWGSWAVGGLGAVATLGLTTPFGPFARPGVFFACAALLGVAAGVMWIAWGERFARQQARFTMARLAPAYGVVLLVLLAVTTLLPGGAACWFVACLPLASTALLRLNVRVVGPGNPPRLLPRKSARLGLRAIRAVCFISFVTAYVTYFDVAIVPWDDLWRVDQSFTFGVMLGAVGILAVGLWARSRPERTVFGAYPLLVLASITACALYMADAGLAYPSFLVALAVSSLFEVMLIAYMGTLTQRGYVPPATAFGLSAGAILFGTCLGNGTAMVFEHNPAHWAALTRWTFAALTVLLAGALITLVRQGYAIQELVRGRESASELETTVAQIAEEYGLSVREQEIVLLLGRGYTAAAVAEKLFISPHTVNTHVQHVYCKLDIHKRSDLLAYLNKRDR